MGRLECGDDRGGGSGDALAPAAGPVRGHPGG
ncbi:MAG: hypothetical protein QOI12_5187, partial [Alphaproteobacteria bacterium]|nr:hypothetical protein [Alphaproteobacteria bacterium]MEA2907800.1 hypothetical protein [Alphaproteobacteria bacterium]